MGEKETKAQLVTVGGMTVDITVSGTWPDVPDVIVCNGRVFSRQFAGYGESIIPYVEVGKVLTTQHPGLPF